MYTDRVCMTQMITKVFLGDLRVTHCDVRLAQNGGYLNEMQ